MCLLEAMVRGQEEKKVQENKEDLQPQEKLQSVGWQPKEVCMDDRLDMTEGPEHRSRLDSKGD